MQTIDPQSLAALIATFVALLLFLIVGVRANQHPKTLTAFFLTSTKPSAFLIIATLAATNTALALTVFWHSFLGWQYGIGAAFWLFICWVIGLEGYAWLARKTPSYPGIVDGGTTEEPRYQTLHEYVTRAIKGDWPRRVLAVSSILTFVLMVNVELTRGVTIFQVVSPGTGRSAIEMIGLVIVLIAAVYAAVGGFHAVIKTDAIQWILSCIAIIVALALALHFLPFKLSALGPVWVTGTPSILEIMLVPRGWAFILGSLFSWGFWFLVTMDMWQRAAAARTITLITAKTRLIYYPWFALLSTTSVLIGLVVRAHDPGKFYPFPAVRFLEIIKTGLSAYPIVGTVAFCIVFVGFIAAMISTLDTYILVIAHSIFRDLPPNKIRLLWPRQPIQRWLVALVTFVIGLGGYPLFLLLARSNFDINSLVYIATSLPFVILPQVLFNKYPPFTSAIAVVTGVLVGWAALMVFVYWTMSGIHSSYSNPSALASWYDRAYFSPMLAAVVTGLATCITYAFIPNRGATVVSGGARE